MCTSLGWVSGNLTIQICSEEAHKSFLALLGLECKKEKILIQIRTEDKEIDRRTTPRAYQICSEDATAIDTRQSGSRRLSEESVLVVLPVEN